LSKIMLSPRRVSVLAALLASTSTAAAFSMQMNYKHSYNGFKKQTWPASFSDTLGGKGAVPESGSSAGPATSDLPPAKVSNISASSLPADILNVVGDPYPPQPSVSILRSAPNPNRQGYDAAVDPSAP
jgi:hypothetical protein